MTKLSKPLETLLVEWEKPQQKESPILSPLLVETVSPSEIKVNVEGKVGVIYLRKHRNLKVQAKE